SDGTAAGTALVKDLAPGADSALALSSLELLNVNGTLFFRASDGANGFELWKSDGTAAGTVLIKDLGPGSGSGEPRQLTNVSGVLLFTSVAGDSGSELWRSNGTEVGTVRVKDINAPLTFGSNPTFLTNVNGTLFFVANDGTHGPEVWKSDGTASGTVL